MLTPSEYRDISAILMERIQLHGRCVGAQLDLGNIAEIARLSLKCQTEAASLAQSIAAEAEAKKKPFPHTVENMPHILDANSTEEK